MSRWRSDAAYFAGIAVGATALVVFLWPLRSALLGIDDFATIWVGPRAFLVGADPYSVATWRDTAVRIGSEHNPSVASVYVYPPWVTIALVPFALLPASTAGMVWTVLGIVAAIVAVRALLRAYLPDLAWAHAVFGFLLLFSSSAGVTFVTGQWTFIFVACLAALVLFLRAGRPLPAGMFALAMLAKPPLFVFTALGLAIRALSPTGHDPRTGRRFVVTAGIAGVLVILVSWIVLPSWWPSWFENAASYQLTITPVTLETLFVTVLGDVGAWVAAIVVLVTTGIALRFDPRGDAWLPTWLALSSANVIYSNTYDVLLLIVPFILAAGALRARSARRATLVVVAAALLLFAVGWSLHAVYARLYAAAIPLTAFVVITGTLWHWRRDLRGSGASARGTAGSSRP